MAHGPTYVTPPGGAWITSDMNTRLAQAGLGAMDGTSMQLKLPDLPLGEDDGPPDTWLQPYGANTACNWEFSTPPGATTTLNIR